jgi:hypothetical protein
MTEFVRRYLRKPFEPRTYVSYDDFMKHNQVRPVTVRLPVSTLAKLDALQDKCSVVWSSRQELLFEAIESSIRDWINAQADPKAADAWLDDIAHKAFRRAFRE